MPDHTAMFLPSPPAFAFARRWARLVVPDADRVLGDGYSCALCVARALDARMLACP